MELAGVLTRELLVVIVLAFSSLFLVRSGLGLRLLRSPIAERAVIAHMVASYCCVLAALVCGWAAGARLGEVLRFLPLAPTWILWLIYLPYHFAVTGTVVPWLRLFVQIHVFWSASVAGTYLAAFVATYRRAGRQPLAARRRERGLCPRCGYDLRATPDRCPECGMPGPPGEET